MRIAISGIPSHWHRTIQGQREFQTLYREIALPVRSKRNLMHETRSIANTGNYLIGEGVRAALAAHSSQHIPLPWLSGEASEKWVEYVNGNFDLFVFGTANIFHRAFDTSREARLFQALEIPILMMSAGIQNKEHFGDAYPPSFAGFIEALKARKVNVLTRGEYTASFLRQHGVQFAEPVGCPSIYFKPENIRAAIGKFPQVAIGGQLEINHSGYLGSVGDTILDINAFGGEATAHYSLQDECILFRYDIEGSDDDPVYDDASGLIYANISFPQADRLRRNLRHRIFFNTDQWRAWISTVDFSMGRRFHGNVIAGQAGVPFFMISVDDRTAEMNDFAGFPSVSASDWNACADKPAMLKDYQASFNVGHAIDRYNTNYVRFRRLLSEFGI